MEDNTQNTTDPSGSTVEDLIHKTMHLAFWDKLESEMKTKNYEMLLGVLDEVRFRVCEMIPNRTDLHNSFYEHIDVDLLEQMLKHDAVDNTYIYNTIQFIIDQLKQLDCIEDEPYYEIWRTQVNKRLEDQECPLYILLPIFLRETFFRIEKIDYSIKMFKESDLYKVIKERRNSIHGDID